MKSLIAAGIIAIICLGVYHPHQHAPFVLDDYYSVVRNPLIKNLSLYPQIWTSHLFDAHQTSGYIKYGYYRPILQSSWVLDYRLFGLNASGYQWLNLLVHALNGFLIYILFGRLFASRALALKASLLFCVLPTQEWVVRYVTGRGDELSAFFALLSLISLLWVFKSGLKSGYIFVFVFWLLSALTREVAISYILYAFLLTSLRGAEGDEAISERTAININRFCLYWVLIGLLPFLLLWSIVPKQGNVLVWHTFYFASAGLCLWLAQVRLRWFVVLFILCASVSATQGRFWTTEEALLRHTRSLECWPRTVVAQQLLIKYDDDIPAIKDMADHSRDPHIKAMWLRRLGIIYLEHRDLDNTLNYMTQALTIYPTDVDTLNALAVIFHYRGQEPQSLLFLERAYEINPNYPDTLRTLGIYYFIHKDFPQARDYLNRCLYFEPNNAQASQLLGLANKMN